MRSSIVNSRAWTHDVPARCTYAYELTSWMSPILYTQTTICPCPYASHALRICHMHVCPCPCSLTPFMPRSRHPWRPLMLSKQLEWDDLPISGLVREQVCYSKFTNDYLFIDMLAFFFSFHQLTPIGYVVQLLVYATRTMVSK